jgi:Protein of unknown function (DUF732)
MNAKRLAAGCVAAAAVAIAAAAPAQADTDTDFANELHTFGIYGPKDYNAWIGKIACKRMYTGTDPNPIASMTFVGNQLPKGSTQVQSWQFLGSAIKYYCPEKLPVLQSAAMPAEAPSAPAATGPGLAAEAG